MSPIPSLVFDLGKVLLDFDYQIASRNLSLRSHKSTREISNFLQSGALREYETGLTSRQEFFARFCSATGYTAKWEDFAVAFADIFSPIEPMINLHSRLRANGFRTYIFSNTNDLAIDHIRRAYPFFENFDDYIFSFQHRAMKPDPALYQVLEDRARQRGPDLLYIDDRPENIATANLRRWRTILHVDAFETLAEVERLLAL